MYVPTRSFRAALLHVLANFVVIERNDDEMLPKNAINEFQGERDIQEVPKEFIVGLAFYYFLRIHNFE